MHISDIMTPSPICISHQASLKDAHLLMQNSSRTPLTGNIRARWHFRWYVHSEKNDQHNLEYAQQIRARGLR
jgi:CBS domain-containing protein